MAITFTIPYVIFMIGVAYNIQQTLDAMGISLITPPMIDSNGHAMVTAFDFQYGIDFLLFFLLIYLALMFIFSLVAAYCIGRWKGFFIGFIIWCTPGVMSILGYWPKIQFLPEMYNIWGAGYLGGSVGMTCLLLMGLITGWIFLVILTDIFSLQDRFRHFYDHIWYSMAIIAAIFFVADTSSGENQRRLQDYTRQFQQASMYLSYQLKQYDQYCAQEKLYLASCSWAHRMRQELAEYGTYNAKLIIAVMPKTTSELYLIYNRYADDKTVKNIREEFDIYNKLKCQNKSSSYDCVATPTAYCIVNDPPKDFDDYSHRKIIVANECIIPTLVLLQKRIDNEIKKVNSSLEQKHIRWFFYFIFSILAGGKVANATARLSKSGKSKIGLGDEKQIIIMAKFTWRLLISIINFISYAFNASISLSSIAFTKMKITTQQLVKRRQTDESNDM